MVGFVFFICEMVYCVSLGIMMDFDKVFICEEGMVLMELCLSEL